MQKITVDSDIIIDHLRNANSILEDILNQVRQKKVQAALPSVVYTEIHSGQETKNTSRLKFIEELLSKLDFIEASEKISLLAGQLLRDYPTLKIADAIVAATALSLNAKLATRNKKDFAGIKNLKFLSLN